MNITKPSRVTFWRFILGVSAVLPFLSIWQAITIGLDLGIDIPARPSWVGLIAGFLLLGLLPLLAWTLTWSRHRERILAFAESPERIADTFRWLVWAVLVLALVGYTVTYTLPFVRSLFGREGWIRFLVFWYFSLLGMVSLKVVRRDTPWFTSLIAVVLMQSTFHLVVTQLSRVSTYPFTLGWSETSRFYYPSLFLSQYVYGSEFPLPILHPTLHLLLMPPYLIHAPLWFHRLWQVLLRLILIGAIVPAMTKRLSIQGKAARWLVALGMYLFLFIGPVYFHLAVPVIIMLYGFSKENDRRTWLVVILASIWCGWSRVNWYPMPGMIAAVLYLLEVPFKGKNPWRYLLKPALWFFMGIAIAFGSQRLYIAISGIPPEYFYTSLASDLLWYRLFPNVSYFLGLLPAALLTSVPMWIVMYVTLRKHGNSWHILRHGLIFAALLVLFLGGLAVSLKIGGGTDLHNMDAYFVMLLIVVSYLVFARYRREDGTFDQPVSIHWVLVVLLLILPVWSQWRNGVRIRNYDTERTQKVLSALQERVDQVNAQGGDILFITQRHLISMGMLKGVTLVPEYEREDLMEMAMGNNTEYLAQFQRDMEDQRFALIVVDPLNYKYLESDRSFWEENNVWVQYAMRPILCNYQLDEVFPEDEIALYVPQEGQRQCPKETTFVPSSIAAHPNMQIAAELDGKPQK